MPDVLEDLDANLDACVQYLNEIGNANTRLGGIFPVFVLGYICAEYQKHIHNAMICRAKKSGDMQLIRYVKLSLRHLSMSADSLRQNISGVFFDDADKNQEHISKKAWAAYKNLITARNRAMHGANITENLDDVIRMHQTAREVVHVIRAMLLEGREYGGISRSTTKHDWR